MMRMMLAMVTGAALGAGSAYAVNVAQSAPVEQVSYTAQQAMVPERIIIGLDLSKSNPLVEDKAFAAKVAARISDRVRKLGFRSEVHIRTLGNFDASSNGFYYDTVLSIKSRPAEVAADVQKLIAGTPMLVAKGKWKAQATTNIIAFLDNVSNSIGCGGMKTTIILASDGIEDSEYAHLASSRAHLPDPDGKPFKGCAELQILGVGQGTRSPIEAVRLRKEWTGWARNAGFSRFQGLNDW
ncbi:MAG: hypothetical protein GC166_03385 [Alphaproteobacteria bacterium]|nr:hypothetical protein [Alphaproteobacteria bacterium]